MKIILLNGPPGSGKDEAANCIAQFLIENTKLMPEHVKFAAPLKNAVHALHGLDVPTDHFEMRKDIACIELFGRTPRELYIAISEKFTKPILQLDFFTKLFLRTCEAQIADNFLHHQLDTIIICSDLGFQVELEKVIEFYGKDNVVLVQIVRPGTDFKNDSRGYIEATCDFIRLNNITTIDYFHNQVYRWLHDYLGRKYGSNY